MRNRIRELLGASTPGFGISINIPDPVVVELVGLTGFDFVFIDLEHSSIGLERLESLLRTAMGHGLGTVVRVPGPHSELTARIVDLGADCILAPRIQSRRDVDALLSVTRFPPIGERGIAEASRTTEYGARRGETSSAQQLNSVQVVGVMIETAGAVTEIDEILKAEGLDFIFIGPEDLAASMGHIGQRGHPEVTKAVEHVIDAAVGAGMPFAMGAGHPAVAIGAEELTERGVCLVLAGRDSNLLLAKLRDVRGGSDSGGHF